MVWSKDAVLAVIKIKMVTEALEVSVQNEKKRWHKNDP